MRKKEHWMNIGAKVIAIDSFGQITDMQVNNINGIDYVYYIHVKLFGDKFSKPYHPSDIIQVV